MFTNFGKILTLAVAVSLLSVGVAVADPASSDWNNSWGFLTPSEKANLLNQAVIIEIAELDGYENTFYNTTNCNIDGSCFFGTAQSIGNQQNVIIEGDDNEVSDNEFENDGNVSSQLNDGDGEIEQDVDN